MSAFRNILFPTDFTPHARSALKYAAAFAREGRGRLAGALWGSTAEEIIAEAPCPVLTIRPPQHDFVEHRGHSTEIRLNRILLATNFRPSSAAATNLARELTASKGAELHAVYVIGDYFEQI